MGGAINCRLHSTRERYNGAGWWIGKMDAREDIPVLMRFDSCGLLSLLYVV
jgi:hypothetical protein